MSACGGARDVSQRRVAGVQMREVRDLIGARASSRGRRAPANRTRRARRRRGRRSAAGGPRTDQAGSPCRWARRTRRPSRRPSMACAGARPPARHARASSPSLSPEAAHARRPSPVAKRSRECPSLNSGLLIGLAARRRRRTRRGGATRSRSRCDPWARGRATDRRPRARPGRAHKWNRRGRRRRPRSRTRSCPAGRACRFARRFRTIAAKRATGSGTCAARQRMLASPVIVFDATLVLLILGDRDVEIEVEIAAERGRPGKRPSHPPLVGLQLRERRARHRPERRHRGSPDALRSR